MCVCVCVCVFVRLCVRHFNKEEITWDKETLLKWGLLLKKEFAPRRANSLLTELNRIELKGFDENGRVASP